MRTRWADRGIVLLTVLMGVAITLPRESATAQGPATSPDPATVTITGSTAPACDGDVDACFRAQVDHAGELVANMPVDIRVEAPAPYQGGQRTDTLVNYYVDTVRLIDGFWEAVFTADSKAWLKVYWVIVPEGGMTEASKCETNGAPYLLTPQTGPFYCSIGGKGDGWDFTTGTVFLAIEPMERWAKQVSPTNYDFAIVTLIAHEMGHHVERQLLNQDPDAVSELSKTWMELGADCLAGVFAHAAYHGRAGQLEDGDVDEGATLLYNIGSDLPYDESGDVHGERSQRRAAFDLGYQNGSTFRCLTETWPET